MRIQIINGPNINLLGKREPGIYGAESFESYLEKLRTAYPDLEIDYIHSPARCNQSGYGSGRGSTHQ